MGRVSQSVLRWFSGVETMREGTGNEMRTCCAATLTNLLIRDIQV
jgi:hypothetical protein